MAQTPLLSLHLSLNKLMLVYYAVSLLTFLHYTVLSQRVPKVAYREAHKPAQHVGMP